MPQAKNLCPFPQVNLPMRSGVLKTARALRGQLVDRSVIVKKNGDGFTQPENLPLNSPKYL